MPYIPKSTREKIAEALLPLYDYFSNNVVSAGDLNFILTKIVLLKNPLNYKEYNELVGVLECVKQEFYRRVIVPYEELKKEKEGDVY